MYQSGVNRMTNLKPWLIRTGADQKLMERTGLDEFTLRRLRKVMHEMWSHSSPTLKQGLRQEGTAPRFWFLGTVMNEQLTRDQWVRVLRDLLDHTTEEVTAMGQGEYPIGPMVVRCMSALFGVRIDFLYLGADPMPDRSGADIDPWPMTQTR